MGDGRDAIPPFQTESIPYVQVLSGGLVVDVTESIPSLQTESIPFVQVLSDGWVMGVTESIPPLQTESIPFVQVRNQLCLSITKYLVAQVHT